MVKKKTLLKPINDAESEIYAGMGTAGEIVLKNLGQPPIVRAEFLRELLLDCSDSIDASGLNLSGAHVAGQLDLSGCSVDRRLRFARCIFYKTPRLVDARLQTLSLEGSRCPGLEGARLRVDGGMWLSNSFVASGTVDLNGASIKHGLNLNEAEFYLDSGTESPSNSSQTYTLNLSGAFIGAYLAINNTVIHGKVRAFGASISKSLELVKTRILPGGRDHLQQESRTYTKEDEDKLPSPGLDLEKVNIGGALLLRDGSISGGLRLYDARLNSLELNGMFLYFQEEEREEKTEKEIKSELAKVSGLAFDASHCQIENEFLTTGDNILKGRVTLQNAACRTFNVDWLDWPKGQTNLDGFTYDRLLMSGTYWNNDILRLLERQPGLGPRDEVFHPQPWEQAARVMKLMGNDTGARRVQIRKARLWAAADRKRHWNQAFPDIDQQERKSAGHVFARLWGLVTNPLRCGHLLAGLVLWIGHGLYDVLIRYGHHTLMSVWWALGFVAIGSILGWVAEVNGLLVRVDAEAPPFQPVIYALDSFVPVLKLGLEGEWLPIKPNSDWVYSDTYWVWYIYWLYRLSGWVIGGFAVAGFTGLARR